MTKDEIVKYWIDSSEMDYQAMESLYDKGHYVWALFVAHLVIESDPTATATSPRKSAGSAQFFGVRPADKAAFYDGTS